ncbi:MAG: succinate dehydrogenase, cytochrome b556 subunit [Proteobacteria bacterium]|nr:succinate dehydrogenase, cytochrome b556 subunit [Pseudomonadota bacterium]
MKRARPLSPHLQIYKPQITSVLSILHRVMGVVLSFGMVGVVLWLLLLSCHDTTCAGGVDWETSSGCYGCFQGFFGGFFGTLLLMGFSFAFFYHLSNGVRHLFWDAGCGYKLETAEKSGLFVVGISLVLTALLWASILL